MVSFEIFVKAMPPSLSELKVLPSFCFAFKIPDNVAASNIYLSRGIHKRQICAGFAGKQKRSILTPVLWNIELVGGL